MESESIETYNPGVVAADQASLYVLRGIFDEGYPTRTKRFRSIKKARNEYEELKETFDEDTLAPAEYAALAGEFAEVNDSDEDLVLDFVKEVLRADKSSTKTVLERAFTGSYWFEGITEEQVEKAFQGEYIEIRRL